MPYAPISMSGRPGPSPRRPLRFAGGQASQLSVLFLAKHALSGGVPHATDGSHAVYHHEMLEALGATEVRALAANSYEVLFDPPPIDFVVPPAQPRRVSE